MYPSFRWVRKHWDSILGHGNNILWQFLHRFHPQHRYHWLDTGLKPGYYDPDVRIPCAIFQAVKKHLVTTRSHIDPTAKVKVWDADSEQYSWVDPATDEGLSAWIHLKEAVDFFDAHRVEIEHESMRENVQEQMEKHLIFIILHLGYLWYP